MSDIHVPEQVGSGGVGPSGGVAARRRVAQPNGWWGMALFLCAEVTLFGTMIGSYFYLDFEAHRWPPPGVPLPEILKQSVATGVVVLVTIPMWRMARAARAGDRRAVLRLLLFAMFVQICYLGFEIYLWRLDYLQLLAPWQQHPASPDHGSAYSSIYFALLTTDHAHVLVGILLDASMLLFVFLRGLPDYQTIGIRGLAMYWYVVNVLIVCVYLTLLSPRL
jgi:heme/copper-type cytochrome/quinol oxidase subunit 3